MSWIRPDQEILTDLPLTPVNAQLHDADRVAVSQKLSRKSNVPTVSWTRDLWCANPLCYPLAHSCFSWVWFCEWWCHTKQCWSEFSFASLLPFHRIASRCGLLLPESTRLLVCSGRTGGNDHYWITQHQMAALLSCNVYISMLTSIVL